MKPKEDRTMQDKKRINDNAYKLELPSHLRTSDVFNVKHLQPYFEAQGSKSLNSWTSSSLPEEDDIGRALLLQELGMC